MLLGPVHRNIIVQFYQLLASWIGHGYSALHYGGGWIVNKSKIYLPFVANDAIINDGAGKTKAAPDKEYLFFVFTN